MNYIIIHPNLLDHLAMTLVTCYLTLYIAIIVLFQFDEHKHF